MSDNLVNRLDRFYQVIKENGIDIPVIIVSRTPFAQDKFDELISNKNKTNKKYLREFSNKYNLNYLDGTLFFNNDDNGRAIDGVHQNDLKMNEIATCFIKYIKDNNFNHLKLSWIKLEKSYKNKTVKNNY